MALPEQIRKQTEAVQELYKQINSREGEGEVTPTEPEATAAAEDGQPASAPAASEVPTPASEPPEGGKQGDDYAHKYKTLQGMYNAEVPRLHQQNKDLTQRLEQMEQLIASLKDTKPAAPEQTERFITPSDEEEFGDSIEVMRRAARDELSPLMSRLAALEATITQLTGNVVPQVQAVAAKQQRTSEQQFWADLSSMVPDFRETNNDEGFQNWLLEEDALSGVTRQTYLEAAQRDLDARRVARFFTEWRAKTGQATVAQSTVPATPTTELEKQVQPGRSRSGGAPTPPQAKTYTNGDIQKFFADVRRGVYKGREAERDKIERDIFAAQQEGRIQHA